MYNLVFRLRPPLVVFGKNFPIFYNYPPFCKCYISWAGPIICYESVTTCNTSVTITIVTKKRPGAEFVTKVLRFVTPPVTYEKLADLAKTLAH